MASRTESATLVPIGDISRDFVGYKIRTAGVVIAYNADNALATLRFGKSQLCVDVSLVTDVENATEVLQPHANVFAIGAMQETPELGMHMLAVVVFAAQGLDMAQWELAARQLSQAVHRSDEKSKKSV